MNFRMFSKRLVKGYFWIFFLSLRFRRIVYFTSIFIITDYLESHITSIVIDSQKPSSSGYFDLLWQEISIVETWKTMKCKVQYSYSLEKRNSLEELLPELSSPLQCKSNLYSRKANTSNLTCTFRFILKQDQSTLND